MQVRPSFSDLTTSHSPAHTDLRDHLQVLLLKNAGLHLQIHLITESKTHFSMRIYDADQAWKYQAIKTGLCLGSKGENQNTTSCSKPASPCKTLFLTKLEQRLQKSRGSFQLNLKLERHSGNAHTCSSEHKCGSEVPRSCRESKLHDTVQLHSKILGFETMDF